MRRRHRECVVRPWAALASTFAFLVIALTVPAAASAHAELSGTQPANEATIEEHPDEVTITFTENVRVVFGGIKAFGPDGERVNEGEATADGEVVTVPIDTEAVGTYAIAWRVTSADGHPIRGAFVFHVEERSDDSVSREEALAASKGSRAKDIAFGIARGALLLGVLVAAGGVLFGALAAGSWRPRWLGASLALTVIALLATYVLDASIAAGLSIGDTLDPEVLREEAKSVYGRATLIRAGVTLLCVVVALVVVRSSRWRQRSMRLVATVPFLALAASLSLSGHAVGEGLTVLRLPLDMLHSIAAAAWIGGLVQLVPWSRATPVDAAVLERYSKLALGSVVVLVVTGSWASYEEIGLSFEALVQTTYGRLVLAKVGLLVATLPIANLNRVRTVPAVREGRDGSADRLRSYVRIEFGLLVLVLAATAWLIQTPPAKVQLRPDFVEKTVELSGGGTMQLILDPAAVGTNEMHVYVFDAQLQPDDEITELRLTAFNDERDLGPLEIDLPPGGPGHFTSSSATIPFDGTWRFEVSARRSKFDESRASFTARVASQKQE